MTAAEGEGHKHSSGFWMGGLRGGPGVGWRVSSAQSMELAWVEHRHPPLAVQTSLIPPPLPRPSVSPPPGELMVTAGGMKRSKLIVLAQEIGKSVTGSIKLAISVRLLAS